MKQSAITYRHQTSGFPNSNRRCREHNVCLKSGAGLRANSGTRALSCLRRKANLQQLMLNANQVCFTPHLLCVSQPECKCAVVWDFNIPAGPLYVPPVIPPAGPLNAPPAAPLYVMLLAAKESCEVMEKEVARLNQLNQDLKSTCQQLQATVDDLSRYNLPQCCAPSASA